MALVQRLEATLDGRCHQIMYITYFERLHSSGEGACYNIRIWRMKKQRLPIVSTRRRAEGVSSAGSGMYTRSND